MNTHISRREFLKVWGISLGLFSASPLKKLLPPDEDTQPFGLGRVTTDVIGLYTEPTFKSQRMRWLSRDKIVDLIAEIESTEGPANNPRWYRLVGGYAHSAYIQRVEDSYLNPPLEVIHRDGQLAEVTVPYSQAYHQSSVSGWLPVYRLYFGSIYWITHLDQGPDGSPWYGLTDDRLGVQYYVPASHLRPISKDEVRPISPQVPPEEKRIELFIEEQSVRAYEGSQQVFQAKVSTGIPNRGPSPNGIPSATPTGSFYVVRKVPSRHMGDGNLTSDLQAYELPGVPWVSYFHAYGIGFHGTYWHDNFGSKMSHGCVNMRNEDARWLYRWTTPLISYREWYKLGRGTTVKVY